LLQHPDGNLVSLMQTFLLLQNLLRRLDQPEMSTTGNKARAEINTSNRPELKQQRRRYPSNRNQSESANKQMFALSHECVSPNVRSAIGASRPGTFESPGAWKSQRGAPVGSTVWFGHARFLTKFSLKRDHYLFENTSLGKLCSPGVWRAISHRKLQCRQINPMLLKLAYAGLRQYECEGIYQDHWHRDCLLVLFTDILLNFNRLHIVSKVGRTMN
jgi:hypothetical protein